MDGREAWPTAQGVRVKKGAAQLPASLDNSGSVVPIVLMVAGMLAVVDGGDLEDPVLRGGALAVAAERGASPLVPVSGLVGLLRLWEGLGGDGPQGQEGEGHGAARVRHCGWRLVGFGKTREQRESKVLVEVGVLTVWLAWLA